MQLSQTAGGAVLCGQSDHVVCRLSDPVECSLSDPVECSLSHAVESSLSDPVECNLSDPVCRTQAPAADPLCQGAVSSHTGGCKIRHDQK